MLITNGIKTRNIDGKKLPEYAAKGYEEVKEPTKKPEAVKTGKK